MARFNKIAQMVNVRQEEAQHVRYLLLYYFLQGVGLALFFTVANSLFLTSFTVNQLPLAYIASAVIMLITGKIYAFIEHKYSRYKRAFLLLVMAASVLLFYILAGYITVFWLPFSFFIWYKVIYNICDLEFWGLSSQLFDTRQAKRLFGLIGAGEVPAKLLGYFSVPLIVPYIGLLNLLLISSLAFFLSFFILRILLRKQDFHGVAQPHAHAPITTRRETLLRFFQSRFILAMGLLYIAGAITFTLIDFSFLTKVEEKFHSSEHAAAGIASFFGLVYGIGNTIIFLFRLFLSGRVISRLGVRFSLLLLPAFVLVLSVFMYLLNAFAAEREPVLWFFVVLMIGGDLFKAVFYEPLFLSLSQPLPLFQRLKSHVIIKGFVDPLGLGITGGVLFAVLQYEGLLSIATIDIALAILAALWVLLVFYTYRSYLLVLKNAIAKRFLDHQELDYTSRDSRQIILGKLESEFPEEVIFAYEVLKKNDRELFNSSLPKLLRHTAPELRAYALRRLPRQGSARETKVLYELATSDELMHIRALAMTEFCIRYDSDNEDQYQALINDTDVNLQYAALKGLMLSGNLEGIMLAGQKVNELLASTIDQNHITVARLIGEMKFKNYYKPLLVFFESDNLKLRKTAVASAGNLRHAKMIPPLFALLSDAKLRHQAMAALVKYEVAVIDYIRTHQQLLEHYPMQIAKICSLVGGHSAAELICNQILPGAEAEVLDECLKGLYAMEHGYEEHDRGAMEQKMNEQAEFIYHLAYHYELLDAGAAIVKEALYSELKNARYRLLLLLSLQYDKTTFRQIIATINKGAKFKNANALEMLDNLLGQEHKQKIFPVFEHADFQATRDHLGKYHTIDLATHEKTDWIFNMPRQPFLQWTYAAVLFTEHNNLDAGVLQQFRSHGSKMLMQIADMALKETDQTSTNKNTELQPSAMEANAPEQNEALLEIEKVLILKSLPMFSETSEPVLTGIAEILREQRIPKDAVIFNEGELGDCLYIIYDGEVLIHNGAQELAKLGNREIFGELALLDPEPRSASATTLTDALLLRIDKEDFDELIESQPEVAVGMLTILSRRIRNQNKLISDLKNNAA